MQKRAMVIRLPTDILDAMKMVKEKYDIRPQLQLEVALRNWLTKNGIKVDNFEINFSHKENK